ncbi:hypothetical protein ACLOJK_001823 [Asimina triloba]
METFDAVKTEKSNAMQRFRHVRKLAVLFRFLEACFALCLLSWLSARLPFAVRFSGDCFRHASVVLVSPLFVFLLGNVIVLTLLAKSGSFSGRTPAAGESPGVDLYDEFLKSSSENRQRIGTESPPPLQRGPTTDEVMFEDKAVCVVHTYTDGRRSERSLSERFPRAEKAAQMRRCETEVEKKGGECGGGMSELEMSSEEFRRKIEAFIAKQQRFRREEFMAIILQSKTIPEHQNSKSPNSGPCWLCSACPKKKYLHVENFNSYKMCGVTHQLMASTALLGVSSFTNNPHPKQRIPSEESSRFSTHRNQTPKITRWVAAVLKGWIGVARCSAGIIGMFPTCLVAVALSGGDAACSFTHASLSRAAGSREDGKHNRMGKALSLTHLHQSRV